MTQHPTEYPEAFQISQLVKDAEHIVIMQADNPDADSLASALALEHILGDMNKQTYLYCGVHIPEYLSYLPGRDRVSSDLPAQFDLTVIVDTSADSLFGALEKSGRRGSIASKPCLVIDHHATQATISYASVVCSPVAVATGEVIYELAQQLDWPVSLDAARLLTSAIMSDSLGLTSEGTSARSIHIVADLVEQGVSIAQLEQDRRKNMRKAPELLTYKGKLLQRIEYAADGRIAFITFPWEEIERYSHAYNPSMLVIDDMRSATGVEVAIAFKLYQNGPDGSSGRITAKIRCNYGSAIGRELAEHFGGGGHAYASGFKIDGGRPFTEVKSECLDYAARLLDTIATNRQQDATSHETVQHTYQTD